MQITKNNKETNQKQTTFEYNKRPSNRPDKKKLMIKLIILKAGTTQTFKQTKIK